MNRFPEKLIPANIDKFSDFLFDNNLERLRSDIYLYLVSQSEEFFSLDNFSCKNKEKAVNIIITELKNLGWTVARLFGNTALIVKPTKSDIENSVWGSSIDLEFC